MNEGSALNQISRAAMAASPALGKVGVWIGAHPLRVLSMSAEEVARQSGASLAAVNRFARIAGFEGFTHLKARLSEEFHETSEPIRKLIGDRAGNVPGRRTGDRTDLFQDAETNLQGARQAIDPATLDEAARRLMASDTVFVLGLGLGNVIASGAALLLIPYLRNVVHVAGEGGTEVAARRLVNVGPKDTLLAVSTPRYSRATVALARHARARGAFVIALTDKTVSPLAAEAALTLIAPAHHAVLGASAVAALATAEVLAARVMQLNPDAAKLATQLSETVLDYLTTGQTKPVF